MFGALCDETGHFLQGATIVASSGAGRRVEAITSARGVYWFGPLPRGEYLVAAYYANCVDEALNTVEDHPRQLVQKLVLASCEP